MKNRKMLSSEKIMSRIPHYIEQDEAKFKKELKEAKELVKTIDECLEKEGYISSGHIGSLINSVKKLDRLAVQIRTLQELSQEDW